jgi:hypothetical protein
MNPQDSHVYSTASCVQLFDPSRGRIVGVLAGCYKHVMPMASKNSARKCFNEIGKFSNLLEPTASCVGLPKFPAKLVPGAKPYYPQHPV